MFQDTILWERKTWEQSSLFFNKIRKEGIDIGLAFDDNVIILSRTLSRENKDSYEGGG